MSEISEHKALQARRAAEREARRRAELMANMARRKAQTRGRAAQAAQSQNTLAAQDGSAPQQE